MNINSENSSRGALHLQASVLSHDRLRDAATALACELAALTGCTRVAVGWQHQGLTRLLAVSHSSDDDLQRPVFNPLIAAMDEAVQQGRPVWSPASDRLAVRLAHQALTGGPTAAAATVPIVAQGRVVGAVTLEWASAHEALPDAVAQVGHLVALAGPVLHLMHTRDLPWRQRLLEAWRKHLSQPKGRRLAWTAGLLATALVALLWLPVEHRVGGHARVQGDAQRSVAAPQDGFIATVAVRPGDRVRTGQLLLSLANEDLLLQQQRWRSELAQHENAYASALTLADRAAMVIALARADKARAQLEQLNTELQRTQITAPMDGVVIEGDLSQQIGTPVERGHALMVIAPEGRYRVAVQVDERDIAHVRVGQPGHLSLSALPWDALPLTVLRIGALATAVDGRNVFEIETDLGAGGDTVRPGLEGVAKLAAGQAPLGWVLLHRVVNWTRLGLWSWWP